jgi:PPP family 3-phenylpropionic acid transporter
MLSLLADRRMLLLLLAVGAIQSSHAVLYGFGTIHWLAAGHDVAAVGALWTIGVVAEIVLFAAGARVLSRLDGAWLLALGGAAAAARWLVAGLTTDLAVLVVIQLLHGLSFGATHLAAMSLLVRLAPARLGATAQALHAAISWGGVFGVVILASGALYGALGGAAFYPMAALGAAGAAGAARLARRLRAEPAP